MPKHNPGTDSAVLKGFRVWALLKRAQRDGCAYDMCVLTWLICMVRLSVCRLKVRLLLRGRSGSALHANGTHAHGGAWGPDMPSCDPVTVIRLVRSSK